MVGDAWAGRGSTRASFPPMSYGWRWGEGGEFIAGPRA